MILPVVAVLKEIYEKGRNYLWPRPEVCPCCKAGRLWGHGFVSAYFEGCEGGVFLRRYRCGRCGCVIRLKPRGYFDRFQSSVETIRASIGRRPKEQSGPSRTRRGHWLRALRRKALAHLGDLSLRDPLRAFDLLIEMGKIPVSRSI